MRFSTLNRKEREGARMGCSGIDAPSNDDEEDEAEAAAAPATEAREEAADRCCCPTLDQPGPA
jgi:hypothetical protein